MTSGREMSVSTSDLPRHSRRANNQATASPNGRISSVLNAETHAVNQKICHSSQLMIRRRHRAGETLGGDYLSTMNPYFSKTFAVTSEFRYWRNFPAAST